MPFTKPTELLDAMDSHGIYAAAMLDECTFDTSRIPQFTRKQTARQIGERGLGGELTPGPDDDLFLYGWTTASALAIALLGDSPGSSFHGRGSSFRADLKALKEAGF